MDAPRTRWIVGCMTGTSLDGLDAALARVTGAGLHLTAEFHGLVSKPLADLAHQLRPLAEGQPAPPLDYLRAARALGELHADAVAELIAEHLPAGETLDFVTAHGQTVWHAPHERVAPPAGEPWRDAGMSWQLFDPWPIVRRLAVPVCYDLRQADLVAGGEGAPITPIADWVLYRPADGPRRVLNLGGICNLTELSPSGPNAITGGDIAPCNLVIDGAVRALFPDLPFDRDGAIAAGGSVHGFAHDALAEHPAVKRRQKSLGREDFGRAWVEKLVQSAPSTLSPADTLASVVDAVARMIARHCIDDCVLAGGGARNRFLVQRIAHHAGGRARVMLSDELGIPCEAREALGFAVLGALSRDGVPITLPAVTGAASPGVAGCWAGLS